MIKSIYFVMDDDSNIIIENERIMHYVDNNEYIPNSNVKDMSFISDVAAMAYKNGVMPSYCCEERRQQAEDEDLLNNIDDSIIN